MATQSTPDGYHSVTPYLIVIGAAGPINSCRARAADFFNRNMKVRHARN